MGLLQNRRLLLAFISVRLKRARVLLKKGNPRAAERLLKKTHKFMSRFKWLMATRGNALSGLEREVATELTRRERDAIKYQVSKARRIKLIAARFKEKGWRRKVRSMQGESLSKIVEITPHLSVAIKNGNRVVAVVDGKIIAVCRYALLAASRTDTEIQTADDLIKHNLSESTINKIKKEAGVTIEDELLAHASNLQGWIEHDYAPHLLDSHIAKPLLEALMNVDPRAKARFLATVREALYGASLVVRDFVFDKYFDLIMESDLADDTLVVKLKGNRHYCGNKDLFECANENFGAIGFSRDANFIAFNSDAERDAFIKQHPKSILYGAPNIISIFRFAHDKSFHGVRESYAYGEDTGDIIYYVVLGDVDSCIYVDSIDDLAAAFIKDLGRQHPSRVVTSLQKLMKAKGVTTINIGDEKQSGRTWTFMEQEKNYMLLYDDDDEMPEIVDEATLKKIKHVQEATYDVYYYVVLDGEEIPHAGEFIEQQYSRYQGSADYSARFISFDELPDDIKEKLGAKH